MREQEGAAANEVRITLASQPVSFALRGLLFIQPLLQLVCGCRQGDYHMAIAYSNLSKEIRQLLVTADAVRPVDPDPGDQHLI